MLALVASGFPDRKFLLVVDSLYSGESVLRCLPEKMDLIGPAHPKGALYAPAPKQAKRGRVYYVDYSGGVLHGAYESGSFDWVIPTRYGDQVDDPFRWFQIDTQTSGREVFSDGKYTKTKGTATPGSADLNDPDSGYF